MMLGTGYPMGPFLLCDFVGVDTTYRIAEIMFEEYRESRYARRRFSSGLWRWADSGRKTGKGFYDWSAKPPRPLPL